MCAYMTTNAEGGPASNAARARVVECRARARPEFKHTLPD